MSTIMESLQKNKGKVLGGIAAVAVVAAGVINWYDDLVQQGDTNTALLKQYFLANKETGKPEVITLADGNPYYVTMVKSDKLAGCSDIVPYAILENEADGAIRVDSSRENTPVYARVFCAPK